MLRPAEGLVIMLVMIFMGTVITFAGGTVIDSMWSWAEDTEYFDATPSKWNTYDDTLFGVNLFYACGALISLLGVVIFVITCLHREGVDTEYTGYAGPYR